MKFDDIMGMLPEPMDKCDQIAAAVDFLLGAEDLSEDQRMAFYSGYCVGITYTLSAYVENKLPDAIRRLTELLERHN